MSEKHHSHIKKGLSPAWPISIVVIVIVALIALQIYIDFKNNPLTSGTRSGATTTNPVEIQNAQVGTKEDATKVTATANSNTNANTSNTPKTNSMNPTTSNTNPSSLQITDIRVGTGAEAKAGQQVTVNYLGTLTNGTKFDSSYDRGQPFTFQLGVGQVIQGWDQGFQGMKVGGKRKLIIPAELAYGNRAIGSIPANSTLVFEVELLDVK
jgi:FKBP-type peptidyl-prolyl cis-trans isomerase